MAYNNRPLSPGGRRIQNQGRTSDSRLNDGLADQYRSERHNSYTSPKSSGGVIPISSETFVNYPPSQPSRVDQQRYDPYTGRLLEPYPSGRARTTSVGEVPRGAVPSSTTAQLPSRSRPTVVQNDVARPSSPMKGSQGKDYYVTPNTSKEPRKETKETHKKVYNVSDGTANLVADVNVPKAGERHHRRRESDGGDRGGYIRPPADGDRSRRRYHLNGPSVRKSEKSIEDEDAYSYTDARGMFNNTEPSWRDREVPRVRRNSVDRGSRERPTSIAEPGSGADPRRLSRDIGPPPSTRGWDKVNEISRSRSVRDQPREPHSPTRARQPVPPLDSRLPQSPTRGGYDDPRDPYYVPPRTAAADDRRYLSVNPEYREPRRPERRNSTTRAPDHSVERRGFGIRDVSQDRYGRGRSDSQDRYGRGRSDSQDHYGRGSNDSQDQYGRGSDEIAYQPKQYRDSDFPFVGPTRRETAPDLSRQDEQRIEQERRDRELERESREKEPRRRDEDARGYGRDYERERAQPRERNATYDIDRERERERERMLQPQLEPERHHHRRSSYRDRDYDQKDNGPRDSGEIISQPGLSAAAAGGLAGAAAVYGLGSHQNKTDDRARERDREPDEDRRRDRSYEHERERVSPRPQDLRPPQEPRPAETHSDEGLPYQQERDRYRTDDKERGLGFAFEAPPEPPKSAPPMRDRPDTTTSRESRDRALDPDFEQSHEDKYPADQAPPTLDPDEDYRRRIEQVQRELGRAPEDKAADSDPERERRRREREQRLRERELRNGESSAVGTNSTYTDTSTSYQMPGSFEDESIAGTDSTGARTLRRKPSILDEPMNNEPAQIIDNSESNKRENRVRIVDPPTEEEEKRPRGILKKPKEKFPEHPNEVREGVAPLKDAKGGSGIPPGARWTKIDRRLVNPEALEDAKERFEERLDCVIVLRVLTKEDIQKLADRTKAIRDERYHEEREEKKSARRRERDRDRRDRDEYEDDSENEFKPRAPMMLEAPASAGASAGTSAGDQADFVREHKDRRRERDADRESRELQYMSGGLGRRDEYSER